MIPDVAVSIKAKGTDCPAKLHVTLKLDSFRTTILIKNKNLKVIFFVDLFQGAPYVFWPITIVMQSYGASWSYLAEDIPKPAMSHPFGAGA